MPFGLTLAPRIILAQRCTCCQMRRDEDEIKDRLIEIKLVGLMLRDYSICPLCYRDVDADTQKDRLYRARWRRVIEKKAGHKVNWKPWPDPVITVRGLLWGSRV